MVEQYRRHSDMSTEELEKRLDASEDLVDYHEALKVAKKDVIESSKETLKGLREGGWSRRTYCKRFLGDSNTERGCNFQAGQQ